VSENGTKHIEANNLCRPDLPDGPSTQQREEMFNIAFDLMVYGMIALIAAPIVGFVFFGKEEGNEFRQCRKAK
jgi:hypothetical protein